MIKQYLARRWGFVTQAEHMKLLNKNLSDLRRTAEHSIMVRENERLALVSENRRLQNIISNQKEEIEWMVEHL